MNHRTGASEAAGFEVSIEAQNGQLAIRLGGELDAAALEELRLVVAQMDRASDVAAVVDLSAVRICDPQGLSELMALRQLLSSLHPMVTFTGVTPRIQRMMEIADVHDLFDQPKGLDPD